MIRVRVSNSGRDHIGFQKSMLLAFTRIIICSIVVVVSFSSG